MIGIAYISEPTTAVVRGGKRSLRARITAREALSNVISRPEVSVCPVVCLFGTVLLRHIGKTLTL